MTTPALRVSDLWVTYGTTRAVAGVSFTIAAGQTTALVGPNGAGKTSTVEVCTGLRRASRGKVELFGYPPSSLAGRTRIGVMLQNGGLYPTARPLEWLTYLAKLYPDPADPSTLLSNLGIDPKTSVTTRRLSGGEQQRVKLAAALLPNPELLFLDEPTAGLDPAARLDLLGALRRLGAEGTGIILTTHALGDVEEIADDVLVLVGGHLVASGPVVDLIGAGDSTRFRATAGLELGALAGALGSGYQVQENRPGNYLVTGPTTPQLLVDITNWCAAAGIQATEIRAGRRTLEDIVVEATRNEIAASETAEAADS